MLFIIINVVTLYGIVLLVQVPKVEYNFQYFLMLIAYSYKEHEHFVVYLIRSKGFLLSTHKEWYLIHIYTFLRFRKRFFSIFISFLLAHSYSLVISDDTKRITHVLVNNTALYYNRLGIVNNVLQIQ